MRDNPNATHWNMEDDNYQSSVNASNMYPHRVFRAGIHDSLRVMTNIVMDISHEFCIEIAPGFLLTLHMPYDLPQIQNEFIHVPPEHNFFISIKPKMITTSDGLRSYAPHKRGCFFKTERRLRFFKSYSQKKCEMECLANFTQIECGCVRFYMPSECN